MAKLGVDRVVIGKVLNHAEGEVTAVYDRHRYDAEKRRALDLWGERLAGIVNGTGGGNVVSLAAVITNRVNRIPNASANVSATMAPPSS